MSKTEDDPLGPGVARRLQGELDRVQPRFSSPRYALAPAHRIGVWRFAPMALVVGLAGMVPLTAIVATGSANPSVWTQRAVNTIHSMPTASPVPSLQEREASPVSVPVHASTPAHAVHTQPTARPRPSESPEAKESESSPSPERSGDH